MPQTAAGESEGPEMEHRGPDLRIADPPRDQLPAVNLSAIIQEASRGAEELAACLSELAEREVELAKLRAEVIVARRFDEMRALRAELAEAPVILEGRLKRLKAALLEASAVATRG